MIQQRERLVGKLKGVGQLFVLMGGELGRRYFRISLNVTVELFCIGLEGSIEKAKSIDIKREINCSKRDVGIQRQMGKKGLGRQREAQKQLWNEATEIGKRNGKAQ